MYCDVRFVGLFHDFQSRGETRYRTYIHKQEIVQALHHRIINQIITKLELKYL